MDGLSAAASIAGVASAGIHLSKCLYDIYSTVKSSTKEIQDIANNVSLLSVVLEELDGVLCQDEMHYKPQLQQAAQAIVLTCATIFSDIRKHTGTGKGQRVRASLKRLRGFSRESVSSHCVSVSSL